MPEEKLKDIYIEEGKSIVEIVEILKKELNRTQTSSALFVTVTDSQQGNTPIRVVKEREEEGELLLEFEEK